jgi:hypothetical protein
MFKKLFSVIIFSFISNTICFSQDAQLQLTSPVTVSPQAAAFSKYGEIPVSLNSGIPNISIPLYTIKTGDIEFPISLSYHASGIKVEEIATNVGLGWSLSYSGNVTRQVRNKPDETTWGYGSSGGLVQQYINSQMNSGQIQDFLIDYKLGYIDGEKDLFFFNMPGNASGKFFLDSNNNQYISIPKSNIRIEQIYISDVVCWRITDDKGMQYLFDQREWSTTETYSTVNDGPSNNTTSFDGVSTWYLGQITDARGNKVIFNYGSYASYFYTKSSETKKVVKTFTCQSYTDCPETRTRVDAWNFISGPKIQSIQWRGGKIVFSYDNAARLDLSSTDTALSEISILDFNHNLVKKYKFYTSYFFSSNNMPGYIADSTLLYRLRLDSLKEISSTGIQNPPYVFEYDQLNMDYRLSNNQDYWGYFNGKNNETFVSFYMNVLGHPTRSGADKEIDTAYTQANLLKKIFYPTGGYTQFDFENNRYKVDKDTFFTFQPSSIASIAGDNAGGSEFQYLFYFNDTFAISQNDVVYQGKSAIRVNISGGCDNPNNYVCYVSLHILGDTSLTIHNGDTIFLAPGDYILQGVIETEFAHDPYASIYATLHVGDIHLPGFYDELAGGLRIKRITTNDGFGVSRIKEINYNMFSENYSSGSIGYNGNLPQYVHDEIHHRRITLDPPYYYDCNCHFAVYSSTSNYPLLTSGGGYVTYANVQTVDKDLLGRINGKTEYYYTGFEDQHDEIYTDFPFPPPCSYEWKRGLLLKQKDYRVNHDSSFTLLKEIINNYTFHENGGDTTRQFIQGMVAVQNEFWDEGMATLQAEIAALQIAVYKTASEIYYLNSDTTRIFDPESTGLYVETINSYDYKMFPILVQSQKTINSKGDTLKTVFKYPSEYNNSGFVSKMLEANMLAVPVEVYNTKSGSIGSEMITGGVISTLKENSLLKDIVYKLNISSPFNISQFQASTINSGIISPDNHYDTLLKFNKYDTSRNIIEQQKKNDVRMTYIWDYSFNYPIAEVINADSSSIAYTSFESDGKGGWSFSGPVTIYPASPTGKKCYNTSGGDITKSGLTSTTYIVSYWGKNGSVNVNSTGPTRTGKTIGDWTYYEHELTTTSITVSGNKYIDELRLYPKGALMTTYTYIPLIGLSSQCDATNRILYYEYDSFNRLFLIRDEDKRVIKKICYNYTGQQENCAIYYNVEKSDSFTRDNCGTGYEGSSVAYIIPAGTYISTVSQNIADSLAQYDVDTNGQAYANANGTCTSNCNSSNCNGLDKKCVNGVCETGVRVCIDSYFDSGLGMFVNTYHYEFSDSTWSSSYQDYEYCDCTGYNCI